MEQKERHTQDARQITQDALVYLKHGTLHSVLEDPKASSV